VRIDQALIRSQIFPPLNPGIAQQYGLISAIPIVNGQGGGFVYDAVPRQRYQFVGPDWIVDSKFGRVPHFTDVDYVTTGTPSVGGINLRDQPFSIGVWARAANNAIFVIATRTTISVATFALAHYRPGNATYTPYVNIRGTITGTGWNLDDSAWHFYAVVYNGTTMTAYYDNAQGALGITIGTAADTAANIEIGGASVSAGSTGDIGPCYIAKRPWTVREIQELFREPFLPFAPEPRVWGFVAAGGSTALVIADALHGHVTDSPALTVNADLVIADALSSSTADSPALTIHADLGIADALSSSTADSPALTIHADLGIADALSSSTADSPALIVNADLVIADSAHTHVADSPALTVNADLIVADALHTHAADNVTLTISGNTDLIVADALHAQTADSPALTINADLIVADALHTHAADSPALIINAALIINDALHAHTADQISFLTAVIALTLRARSTALVLQSRDLSFSLPVRSTGLTLEDR
jgi:hypothetical protein